MGLVDFMLLHQKRGKQAVLQGDADQFRRYFHWKSLIICRGKDYFICTGPTAMLVPVVEKPSEDWKG
ncbi:hypothetical protein SADUNF_Sadunf13G0049100 [Salix dunnii]|uniref:Uncharacterized protein n=1 Tax=Salix dunnii TaxID=1413687 RepID=A0A835MUP2_9ROSI|nr:hypothetical protein SADUNF_Sadunf13G0049100 [Salix dunnii]